VYQVLLQRHYSLTLCQARVAFLEVGIYFSLQRFAQARQHLERLFSFPF
jgi:hypothetical protein